VSALAVELHARRASHRTWAGVVTALLCVAALALPTPGIGLQLGLAALVIVALGLPHGALDAMVALRDVAGLGRARFLALYLALAAATVLAWYLAPVAVLVAFLVLSVVHFGRGDQVDPTARGARSLLETAVRGSAPIVLPALFWPASVALVFGWLVDEPTAVVLGAVEAWSPLLATAWAVGLVALLVGPGPGRDAPRSQILSVRMELIVLVAAFALLPPLVSFAVYFGLWHSVRHLIALDVVLRLRDGLDRRRLVLGALPILAASVALFAVAYGLLADASFDPRALARTLFVGLAALTVPHAAVTLLVDAALRRDGSSGELEARPIH
jgi:beta-carotene 15,15'-dioxygenase